MKKIVTFVAMIIGIPVFAQDTASNRTPERSNAITFTGYVEGYYSYDFRKPANNSRPGFLYSHNRHNEYNVNLAFLKGSYSAERVRANLAIATGTYMNANYATEPATLKNIFEANVGYKLSSNKNWWLDIGIMPSHIGFESAIGKDNWTLTRSLVADNSPYFESGAKLSYGSNNGKFSISLLALNGWQRITRVEGNSLMSWGTQLYFKPSDKVAVNYSTFFGTDKPDSARLFRLYHNLYGIFQFTGKISFTAGFDAGTEDKTMVRDDKNIWYSSTGILRYTPNDKWAFALRGEYFSDGNGVIIATAAPNGFKTTGISAGIDFFPVKNAVLRLEIRNLSSRDKIFIDNSGMHTKKNTALTFSSAVGF